MYRFTNIFIALIVAKIADVTVATSHIVKQFGEKSEERGLLDWMTHSIRTR